MPRHTPTSITGIPVELLLILIVGFVIYKLATKGKTSSRTTRSRTPPQAPPPSPAPGPASKDTYRPNATRPSTGITFGSEPTGTTTSQKVSQEDVRDLCDAFTGEKLDVSKGLFRCEKCKVHYHTESHAVLLSENGGACVACGSKDLVRLKAGAHANDGRNFDPSVVTLSDIKNHVGRVVTFEGHVHSVQVSRRGSDYAVMFEQKSWVKGFKLVFFKGAAARIGGAPYIKSLNGRTVKVRGLVVNHPTFGLEIIISERSMILSAR